MFVTWWLYAPAAVWLLASGVASVRDARIPTWVMAMATAMGVAFTAIAYAPLWAIVSFTASIVVFVAFALSGFVKRSTTVTVVPVIAALPPGGWWPLLAGAGALGVLSALMLLRSFGRDHVGGVAVGTLHALGVGGVGPRVFGLAKPQLDAFPVPPPTRHQPRIPVGFVLAAPVMLFAGLSALLG